MISLQLASRQEAYMKEFLHKVLVMGTTYSLTLERILIMKALLSDGLGFQVPVLPFPSCVPVGKSLNLSEHQFPNLYNRANNICLAARVRRFCNNVYKELTHTHCTQ